MSSAGHILDMIKRQKANRALQKSRRTHYASKIDSAKSPKSKMRYNASAIKVFSPEERELINKKVRSEIKRDQNRSILIAIIVLAVLVLVFVIR